MKKETKLIISEILLLAEKDALFEKGGWLERLDISDEVYQEAKQDFNKEKTKG